MKRLMLLAPALAGALFLTACDNQQNNTETMTIDSTVAASDTSGIHSPSMSATTTTTVTTDGQSANVVTDSDTGTGRKLRNDMHQTGQDLKEGYKDARDATAEKAGEVGHDVKQGYKNRLNQLFFHGIHGAGQIGSSVGICFWCGRRSIVDELIVHRRRAGIFRNEHRRHQAKQAYQRSKYPGAFFQHICTLFNTHQLVTEAAQ